MYKSKKRIREKYLSFLMAFLLAFSFLAGIPKVTKAEGEEKLPKADMMAILVGDFVKEQGLGNDWDTKNLGTLMKEYSKGRYMLTVDFKIAKEYHYKVAFDGQWDNPKALGDNGENKKLNITSPGKVTFYVDSAASKVYDSINDKDQFKASATLVGNLDANNNGGQNWNPGDSKYDLQYVGEGFYKRSFNLKAGNYEYKVAYNHAWSNGEVGSNILLKLDKDEEVVFLANPILGICLDSINNPEIKKSLSLIGTIRGGNEDWEPAAKGYEFSYLNNEGKLVYSSYFKEGKYEYKGIENYSWDGGGIPSSGNREIIIPSGGKYVVFVADSKNKTLIDSINDLDKVSETLGLKQVPIEVKSPVINANGSVTFNYKNKDAKDVYIAGTMTNWQEGKKAMTLINSKEGLWSITLNLGDEAYKGAYKLIVDGNWITDPSNSKALDKDGNSIIEKPLFKGRTVVIPGTIQGVVGESNWKPDSEKTKMTYMGNGIYTFTFKNVPAGTYEYKVAMGSWSENYGAKGIKDGENIKLVVPIMQDVTFTYSDYSNFIVDSINYKILDIDLKGTGIKEGTKLKDDLLTGIYKEKITLTKGTYKDIKAVVQGKEYNYAPIEVKEDSKEITFSFDPTTEMVFTDASSTQVDANKLYFNSKDLKYKAPFGAVPTETPVTFNLKTGKDITMAKLILVTEKGTEKVDMIKGKEGFDDNSDKWTATYTFNKIAMNKYYFVVSNGSDVKAYGDDDGYFGPGMAGNLGDVKLYDINAYDKDFKTPDWMKKAVVYQIFPDRFFDGDESNKYLQKLARGMAPYEFYEDWYAIPENPNLEYEKDEKGNIKLDTKGNPIINKDYKGTIGDGYKNIWCNEMYGGDLRGVSAKLDYLQGLGVNVLYLNPVSASISNHRYDTTDYRVVDPLLGNMDDFVNLAKEAKARDMHLILDGVFNHVSDDSVYFDRYGKYMAKNKPLGAYQYWSRVYDLMNLKNINQQEAEKEVTKELASKGITDLHYKDWFKIDNKKVPAVLGSDEHYEYEGWWGYDSMPVIQALDGSEYKVKSWAEEIIDGNDSNTKYWLRQGSNGWRLDVANEVSDETWNHFRQAVKSQGDNVIIGEIWTDASKYILGDMYDSVMNYRFRDALIGYLREDNTAEETMNKLELIREQYPKEAFEAMLNLVDSHDTERILTSLDGVIKDQNDSIIAKDATEDAKSTMRLVPFIQMTYPGAPCIYYGDEIGMVGAKDPDNRRAMNWGRGDKDLVEWYAKLANIRNSYEVLQTGDMLPITLSEENKKDIMAFSRSLGDNHAVVAINRSKKDIKGVALKLDNIKEGSKLTNALNPSESYVVSKGSVTINIPKQSGVILVKDYKEVVIDSNSLRDAYDANFIVKPVKAPKTEEQVKEEISNSTEKEVIVSAFKEEVTKDVFNTAKEKGKIPVIQRGDTTFKFQDDKFFDNLNNLGITGLILWVEDKLENMERINELLKESQGKLIKPLRFENNLPGGEFGAKVDVISAIDAKYNGYKVYVYHLMADGTYELVASPVCGDGKIEFAITRCGDYFITDKPLVKNSNNNGNNPSEPGKDPDKPGKGENPSNPNESGNKPDLPKTGEAATVNLILLGSILSLSGLWVLRKKCSR